MACIGWIQRAWRLKQNCGLTLGRRHLGWARMTPGPQARTAASLQGTACPPTTTPRSSNPHRHPAANNRCALVRGLFSRGLWDTCPQVSRWRLKCATGVSAHHLQLRPAGWPSDHLKAGEVFDDAWRHAQGVSHLSDELALALGQYLQRMAQQLGLLLRD